MVGPPGSGKTLLARSLPSILPRMTPTEALDVTRIYSVAGMLPGDVPLIRHRPFPRLITPSRTPGWSAAGNGRGRARSAWRTGACSSWTRCRSSANTGWKCSATPGRPDRHHQPRAGQPDLPGEFHAGRRAKPVSLRLLGRPGTRLLVQPDGHQPLPEAALRPAAGSDRHPRRGPARPVPEAQTSAAGSRRPRSGRGSRRRGRGNRRGSPTSRTARAPA